MSKPTKILIFTDWYLPGYNAGGPIQSVANLVGQLKDSFDISIVTSNIDLGSLVPYKDIAYNTWLLKKGYRVIYLDKSHQNLGFYKSLWREQTYDAIYLNSLFSVKFTLLPLYVCIHKPVRKVLAPRGMLGAGALDIKSFKKRLFLSVFKFSNWHKRIIWHATATVEANEIRAAFGNDTRIMVAPNLSSKMAEEPIVKPKEPGYLNVFFLSRIMSKKNLKFALEVLKGVDDSYQIKFTIIGNIEDKAYWEACELMISEMPAHVSVMYIGAVLHHKIHEVLKTQHVMLFPTHHENFGHVIMESWQCAAPVILSKDTPWKNLETKHIGYDLPLADYDAFVNAVNFFAAMDAERYAVWSAASFAYAKAFTEDPKLVAQSRALFEG